MENFTTASANQIGTGMEINDNSHLLPIASTPKHSALKGDNYYCIFSLNIYYFLN